jgi:hypothetical protein
VGNEAGGDRRSWRWRTVTWIGRRRTTQPQPPAAPANHRRASCPDSDPEQGRRFSRERRRRWWKPRWPMAGGYPGKASRRARPVGAPIILLPDGPARSGRDPCDAKKPFRTDVLPVPEDSGQSPQRQTQPQQPEKKHAYLEVLGVRCRAPANGGSCRRACADPPTDAAKEARASQKKLELIKKARKNILSFTVGHSARRDGRV